MRTVETRYGPVRFKVAHLGDQTVNISPEYEDCKRLALEKNLALRDVMEEASSMAVKLKHGNG
jgi:pyridinium-3,5-bisthiocarboxylic acid mononucleotide nickel chelatase